jgi:glycerol-3-phosphate acyltransferase PlsY
MPSIALWLFAQTDRRLARTAECAAPLGDALKAFLPVAIVAHGAGTLIGLYCAVAAVAGDCFSPWLRFRGGTGAAAAFGTMCLICVPAALIYALVWMVSAVASRSIVVGSLLAGVVSLLPLWFYLGAPGAWYATALFVLVSWGNREGLRRLRDGEPETVLKTRVYDDSVVLQLRQASERVGV